MWTNFLIFLPPPPPCGPNMDFWLTPLPNHMDFSDIPPHMLFRRDTGGDRLPLRKTDICNFFEIVI